MIESEGHVLCQICELVSLYKKKIFLKTLSFMIKFTPIHTQSSHNELLPDLDVNLQCSVPLSCIPDVLHQALHSYAHMRLKHSLTLKMIDAFSFAIPGP